MWDKVAAMRMALDHLGLSKQITLETIPTSHPRDLADGLRSAIGQPVSGGGGPIGTGGRCAG
jgi:hypothetical protein